MLRTGCSCGPDARVATFPAPRCCSSSLLGPASTARRGVQVRPPFVDIENMMRGLPLPSGCPNAADPGVTFARSAHAAYSTVRLLTTPAVIEGKASDRAVAGASGALEN